MRRRVVSGTMAMIDNSTSDDDGWRIEIMCYYTAPGYTDAHPSSIKIVGVSIIATMVPRCPWRIGTSMCITVWWQTMIIKMHTMAMASIARRGSFVALSAGIVGWGSHSE
jgi:hypothetical protein